MTEEQIALGRRAVACKGWRWMPGMLARDARWILHRIQDDGSALDLSDDILERGWGYSTETLRPIFDDPATLGCLLALVREARGEPTYLPTCLDVHDEAWVVNPPIPWRQTRYESYASVLVAALEAAPCTTTP
jgi:hypothetical protein